MVCYARAAGRMAAILLIVFLAFGGTFGHYLGETAVLVAITVATAGASIAAALAFAAFLSIRRNRAAAGECVSCTFRCQHPMTEQPRRLTLVTSVDRREVPAQRQERAAVARRPDGPHRPAESRWPDRSAEPRWPDRSAEPRWPDRSAEPRWPDRSAGPRWPDRPVIRSVPPRGPAPGRRVERLRA